MILLRRSIKIGNLFWGAIFFFMLCPLCLFLIFTVPGFIIQDIKTGLFLIKEFEFLHGLGILTRPVWMGAIIYSGLALIAFSDEIGNRIVRWFSGK